MILAVDCLVDLQNRKADHPDAEKYRQLAQASLRNACHGIRRNQRGDDCRSVLRNLVPPRFLGQEESCGVRMGPTYAMYCPQWCYHHAIILIKPQPPPAEQCCLDCTVEYDIVTLLNLDDLIPDPSYGIHCAMPE